MTSKEYPARLRARIESRDTRLQALGYRDYNDYLGSAEWVKTKAHFRKLGIGTCGLCDSDSGLQLHHLTYERVGEESMFDLTWLCVDCHAMVHTLEQRGVMGLDFAGFADFERAAVYAKEQAVRRDEARRQEQEIERSQARVRGKLAQTRAMLQTYSRRLDSGTFLSFLAETEERLTSLESNGPSVVTPRGEGRPLSRLDPRHRRAA